MTLYQNYRLPHHRKAAYLSSLSGPVVSGPAACRGSVVPSAFTDSRPHVSCSQGDGGVGSAGLWSQRSQPVPRTPVPGAAPIPVPPAAPGRFRWVLRSACRGLPEGCPLSFASSLETWVPLAVPLGPSLMRAEWSPRFSGRCLPRGADTLVLPVRGLHGLCPFPGPLSLTPHKRPVSLHLRSHRRDQTHCR